MDATALRTKQAPLKSQYKSSPDSALLTLKSSGTLSSTSIACSLSSGPAIAGAKQKIAGLHPAAGGDDPDISGELCSGDMLLEALVACAGVTLKAVATAMEIEIREGEVRAEGDLDFRGTMGVDVCTPHIADDVSRDLAWYVWLMYCRKRHRWGSWRSEWSSY